MADTLKVKMNITVMVPDTGPRRANREPISPRFSKARCSACLQKTEGAWWCVFQVQTRLSDTEVMPTDSLNLWKVPTKYRCFNLDKIGLDKFVKKS